MRSEQRAPDRAYYYALGRIQSSLQRGELKAAIDALKELIEERPADLRLQHRLGRMLQESGQLDAARLTYRLLARRWEEIGYQLRAVTSYQALLELDPGDLNARRHLAELYASLHLYERARAAYRELADIFLAQGNGRRRLAMLERIVAFQPDDVETRLQLDEALYEAGEASAANEHLLAAIDTLALRGEWRRHAALLERYTNRVPEDGARVLQLQRVQERMTRQEPRSEASRLIDLRQVFDTADLAGVFPSPGSGMQRVRQDTPRSSRSSATLFSFLGSAQLRAVESFFDSHPEHTLSHALRASRGGDAILALTYLGEEPSPEHAHVHTWLRGLSAAQLERWGDALDAFLELVDHPMLGDEDRAIVARMTARVAEATGDEELAAHWRRVALDT